ncbi:carboxylesterase family domain-containing protein [Ditylenchus destructor]|nr:carboxylesterase family domain-containing protein [Ditylenchus destructor]
MTTWSRCNLPWIMLILMEVALIMGNSAAFVDELFASEPEVTEVVDVEKGITYKGLSGEVHVQHPDGRAKRDASDNHFYKGSAWVFLNIPYVVPLDNTTVFNYSAALDADAFNQTMNKRHEDEANYRRFGNFCPQVESNLTEYYRNYCFSEMAIDCLNLNVFTPVLTNVTEDKLLPVYVLFHGGKLSHGSSCDFGRQGLIQNFVMQDIIVVTVNYRLGLYGYLKTDMPNRGLCDQHQSLLWVQKHIIAFKGDNNSVTIGGFEAGACSAAFIAQDNYERVNYYVSDKDDLMGFFTKYLVVDNKTLERDLRHLFNRKTDAMKLLMSYIFTYNVLTMAKELNDKGHHVYIYRFNYVPDANLFADIETDTKLLKGKVPHGTDFLYAYLPPQYWKEIIATNHSETFNSANNVSKQWTAILVNLIKGNIKDLEPNVSRYDGDYETGSFLEFDGGEYKSERVIKNLLSSQEYEAWYKIYEHRNNKIDPAATTPCQNCKTLSTAVVPATTKSPLPSSKTTIPPNKTNGTEDGDKTTAKKPF